MEERLSYALENFFCENFKYYLNDSNYELIENATEGKSKLLVYVNANESICVKNCDCDHLLPKWGLLNKNNPSYLHKCIDHFILTKVPNGEWKLHAFEMKTTMRISEWNKVRYKVRSSYLAIKAIAIYLGIHIKDENITVYTTYEKDRMGINNMSDPQTILPKTGHKAFDVKSEEWDADCIRVPMIVSEDNPLDFKSFIPLHHKKINMRRSNDDILEGEISL